MANYGSQTETYFLKRQAAGRKQALIYIYLSLESEEREYGCGSDIIIFLCVGY
jgi:hypothetical protein